MLGERSMTDHPISQTETVRPVEHVGLAELGVGESPTILKTHGLGSCLAVAFYDPTTNVGGLTHAMLPEGSVEEQPGKYVTSAIKTIIPLLLKAGADRTQLQARLVGGGAIFEFESVGSGVGSRNVAVAREVLSEYDIPVLRADVGGKNGRTVELDTATGELRVTTTEDNHD